VKAPSEEPVVVSFYRAKPQIGKVIDAVSAKAAIVVEEIESTTNVRSLGHGYRRFETDSERRELRAGADLTEGIRQADKNG